MKHYRRIAEAVVVGSLSVCVGLGAVGCAGGSQQNETSEDATQDINRASDEAIKLKLQTILEEVEFHSEGSFPYRVLHGDVTAKGSPLTEAVVRQKLKAEVIRTSSSQRDISAASCLSSKNSVDGVIRAGEEAQRATSGGGEPDDYQIHDIQLMLALKAMKSQLSSVVSFSFGESSSGDQDDVGPVVIVYVGISKTTGKLIGIMTESVRT